MTLSSQRASLNEFDGQEKDFFAGWTAPAMMYKAWSRPMQRSNSNNGSDRDSLLRYQWSLLQGPSGAMAVAVRQAHSHTCDVTRSQSFTDGKQYLQAMTESQSQGLDRYISTLENVVCRTKPLFCNSGDAGTRTDAPVIQDWSHERKSKRSSFHDYLCSAAR